MVMPTEAEDNTERWFAKMYTTISLFKKPLTEYCVGRTVECDETNHVLVHCRNYHLEVIPRQSDQAKFLALD